METNNKKLVIKLIEKEKYALFRIEDSAISGEIVSASKFELEYSLCTILINEKENYSLKNIVHREKIDSENHYIENINKYRDIDKETYRSIIHNVKQKLKHLPHYENHSIN